ncbi:MAG: hypothetical protein GY724_30360, partial [Actinomycetia bacterium]|nr:hypothetical protein [Actinomycetes bacterium]
GEPKAAMAHVEAAQLPMEKVERAMPIDAMRTRLLLADAALQLDLLDLAATCLDGAAVNRAKVGDTGVLGSQLDQLRARLDQMVADSGTGSVLAGELELSPRELELVALLPTRMTYRGIAAELHISVNTVKTHLRNIYGKLGVSTRDEAVDRGQELDLF